MEKNVNSAWGLIVLSLVCFPDHAFLASAECETASAEHCMKLQQRCGKEIFSSVM